MAIWSDMSVDDDLTPRLGRIRDIGHSGGRRFAAQVKRAARQLAPKRSSKGFSGRHIGAGSAKARQFAFQSRRLAAMRVRRVMVKVHIARGGRGGGLGAFRAHVNYLQRDGVDRDGAGGELYGRDGPVPDASGFLERSVEDRHQFRIIVSPEDGEKLSDLRAYSTELMAQVETDLGNRLDWVAVDHFNTGHPHTHIVIRGKDERGRDLIMAPEYLKSGLRHRASELATEQLGPRRDLEIARAEHSQIDKDRFTKIDRAIMKDLSADELHLDAAINTSADRFRASLKLQRLRHLRGLRLAQRISSQHWRMSPGWGETLAQLGRRGDIIRSLAAKFGTDPGDERLQSFEPKAQSKENLLGTVISSVPNDELKGTRTLIVEDFKRRRWIVDIGRVEPGALPLDKAIVEVSPKRMVPGVADRTIVQIAELSGGTYSETLHRDFDSSASPEFRKAHVRRLEALRRKGIVQRDRNEVWRVPSEYLEKVAHIERQKSGAVDVRVRSWMSLERQVSHNGLTWLDDPDSRMDAPRIQKALNARRQWLRSRGLIEEGASGLSPETSRKLAAAELDAVKARLANSSQRRVKDLPVGGELNGRYEGAIDLGTKRMAIIGNAKEFSLVPWRKDIERYRGGEMIARRTTNGVSWTLGRTKTLGISR